MERNVSSELGAGESAQRATDIRACYFRTQHSDLVTLAILVKSRSAAQAQALLCNCTYAILSKNKKSTMLVYILVDLECTDVIVASRWISNEVWCVISRRAAVAAPGPVPTSNQKALALA